MKNLKMYCITNKTVNFLDSTQYNIGWVGKEIPPKNYTPCNSGDNIFYKEKYYSELTFQYWYWKNKLDLHENSWVGFCQKRRFWINKKISDETLNKKNFLKKILTDVPDEWDNFDSVICDPINVNKVKKIKMLKRGFRSLLKEPSIFFNEKKQTLAFHFDMHHGYGNLSKAINLMNKEDKTDFLDYANKSTSFNPHIMFIAKPIVLDRWFNTLFPWLLRCEDEFGFKDLQGYDTQRLYAYLAERYLSFWFNKHTKTITWPWKFFDASQS
jgi:hypothetical protein